MIKAAVLGYGTVGSGILEVFHVNKDIISLKAGENIEIKYIFGRHDYKGTPAERLVVNDFEKIVQDREIKIIAEALGGIEPAYTFVKRALISGKNVVTANKELVAEYGAELIKTAKEHKVNFLFEASVAGGIPVIRSVRSAVTADKIKKITGILNGTTNYILSEMLHNGADYAECLKEAQNKGYAEKDPEADVEGVDACRKIAILLSIISQKQVDFRDIYTEGITKVTSEDVKYAKKMNMKIKLLASSYEKEGRIYASVSPCLIREGHPLYNVDGVYNAVLVSGNISGDLMFYGSGAGKLPTAGAVAADMIEIVKNPDRNLMPEWTNEKQLIENRGEMERSFFVRMSGNKNDQKEKIEKVFGKTRLISLDELTNEFGFVTEKMKEKEYQKKAEKISDILEMIRIEE